MFFQIGQEVVLKFTGDKGIVTELHSDGMVVVYVAADDMKIPVYQEDIVQSKDFRGVEKPKFNDEKVKAVDAVNFPIATQYGILTSLGLQLAFFEVKRHENIEKYKIYLVNDTDDEAIFVFKLKVNGKIKMEIDGKTESLSVLYLGDMSYDDLNESLFADFEFSRITTAGLEEVQHKSLKIKAQHFFRSIIMVPLLNKMAHHFVVTESLILSENTPKKSEDLKAYTKRATKENQIQPVIYNPTKIEPYRTKNDLMELANFSQEIDLHIENLVKDHASLTNSQILTIQLAHFDRFMQKAYRLGVDRVFIIHGVGKGKLRNEIATRLIGSRDFDIHTFKNEYHPKYGFGATEVIF